MVSVPYGTLLPKRKEAGQIFVIIAIGSNLPGQDGASPLQICNRAVRAIANLPGISDVVRSRWYASAPVPPSGQPDYINGAVRARTDLAPATLLAALQGIEHAAGRVRGEPNAARTLDLDIIDMDGLVQSHPDPILPHPRAHLRGFVLYPLRDVAPGWVHPASGDNVPTMIGRLGSSRVRLD
jgi:2-amino-4-hydroxy-6-hydroxymethyldihydropteridine diphosphokinase